MTTMKVQPAILRKLNERRVLNAIRVHGQVSRTDIQKEVHLTLPTVSRIIDGLLTQDWVREVGVGDTTLGRPPMMLEMNPGAAIAVGIELGRALVRVVFVNLLGEIVVQKEYAGASIRTIDDLVAMVDGVLEGVTQTIIGIGVAAPGSKNPHPESAPRLKDPADPYTQWNEQPIEQALEAHFGLPTFFENDANAAVLGEMWFGNGREARHLLFIFSDVGVGAGIAVNGSIYQGENNGAGEFAHTIVDLHGDIECGCGRKGCMGSLSHTAAILEGLRRAGSSADRPLHDIVSCAEAGQEPEASVVGRTLDYLSIGISNLIQVIDPSMVILGGSTFLAHPYMVRETNRRIQSLLMTQSIRVQQTQFGDQVVAIGAATLVLQHVYDHTQLIDSP